MRKLKACPFCGGDAVMHVGEYPARYANHEKEIPKDARIIRDTRFPSGVRSIEYRQKAYIPQCADSSCLGRVRKPFETRKEAVEAWNQRADKLDAENHFEEDTNMDRNLDGCYFRVKREGKWQNVCFTDLTHEERNKVLEGRSAEWLKSLCVYLADVLRGIGDALDLVREDDDE